MAGLRERDTRVVGLVGIAAAGVAVSGMRYGTTRTAETSASRAPVSILVFYDMEGASGVLSAAGGTRARAVESVPRVAVQLRANTSSVRQTEATIGSPTVT